MTCKVDIIEYGIRIGERMFRIRVGEFRKSYWRVQKIVLASLENRIGEFGNRVGEFGNRVGEFENRVGEVDHGGAMVKNKHALRAIKIPAANDMQHEFKIPFTQIFGYSLS